MAVVLAKTLGYAILPDRDVDDCHVPAVGIEPTSFGLKGRYKAIICYTGVVGQSGFEPPSSRVSDERSQPD